MVYLSYLSLSNQISWRVFSWFIYVCFVDLSLMCRMHFLTCIHKDIYSRENFAWLRANYEVESWYILTHIHFGAFFNHVQSIFADLKKTEVYMMYLNFFFLFFALQVAVFSPHMLLACENSYYYLAIFSSQKS